MDIKKYNKTKKSCRIKKIEWISEVVMINSLINKNIKNKIELKLINKTELKALK